VAWSRAKGKRNRPAPGARRAGTGRPAPAPERLSHKAILEARHRRGKPRFTGARSSAPKPRWRWRGIDLGGDASGREFRRCRECAARSDGLRLPEAVTRPLSWRMPPPSSSGLDLASARNGEDAARGSAWLSGAHRCRRLNALAQNIGLLREPGVRFAHASRRRNAVSWAANSTRISANPWRASLWTNIVSHSCSRERARSLPRRPTVLYQHHGNRPEHGGSGDTLSASWARFWRRAFLFPARCRAAGRLAARHAADLILANAAAKKADATCSARTSARRSSRCAPRLSRRRLLERCAAVYD